MHEYDTDISSRDSFVLSRIINDPSRWYLWLHGFPIFIYLKSIIIKIDNNKEGYKGAINGSAINRKAPDCFSFHMWIIINNWWYGSYKANRCGPPIIIYSRPAFTRTSNHRCSREKSLQQNIAVWFESFCIITVYILIKYS